MMTEEKDGPGWAATTAPGATLCDSREHCNADEARSKCAVCGHAWPTPLPAWLYELDALVTRRPELGIGPDLAAVCLCEAWGLLCFLSKEGG